MRSAGRKKCKPDPNNRCAPDGYRLTFSSVESPTWLADSTSSEVAPLDPTLVVPVGSVEQHGPHLPLDTDTRIANAVVAAVLDRLAPGRYLGAPALCYGASGEHEGFAGTVSIGTEVLESVLVEYGRSACRWTRRVVFVNGHGGNVPALVGAVRRLRAEGRDVAWCAPLVDGADAHAGHTETSVLLHLCPADVRTERIEAGNSAPLSELMPMMRRGGLAAVSEVGILGDPRTATAAAGARILAAMVDGCARRIGEWNPGGTGMLA